MSIPYKYDASLSSIWGSVPKLQEVELFQRFTKITIEDKPKNAELGASYGLQSILVAHDHNAYYDGDIPRYWKWKDIYKHITGEI